MEAQQAQAETDGHGLGNRHDGDGQAEGERHRMVARMRVEIHGREPCHRHGDRDGRGDDRQGQPDLFGPEIPFEFALVHPFHPVVL